MYLLYQTRRKTSFYRDYSQTRRKPRMTRNELTHNRLRSKMIVNDEIPHYNQFITKSIQ